MRRGDFDPDQSATRRRGRVRGAACREAGRAGAAARDLRRDVEASPRC